MALLLWRNINIMTFRGSLGNDMAAMVLSFNRMLKFPIYLGSLCGQSITLFTFALIWSGMLYNHTYCMRWWEAQDMLWDANEWGWRSRLSGTGVHLDREGCVIGSAATQWKKNRLRQFFFPLRMVKIMLFTTANPNLVFECKVWIVIKWHVNLISTPCMWVQPL